MTGCEFSRRISMGQFYQNIRALLTQRPFLIQFRPQILRKRLLLKNTMPPVSIFVNDFRQHSVSAPSRNLKTSETAWNSFSALLKSCMKGVPVHNETAARR